MLNSKKPLPLWKQKALKHERRYELCMIVGILLIAVVALCIFHFNQTIHLWHALAALAGGMVMIVTQWYDIVFQANLRKEHALDLEKNSSAFMPVRKDELEH